MIVLSVFKNKRTYVQINIDQGKPAMMSGMLLVDLNCGLKSTDSKLEGVPTLGNLTKNK